MPLRLAIVFSLFVTTYSGARHQQTSPSAPTDPFSAADVYPDKAPSVNSPRLIKAVKPSYTSRAMQDRIEGVVKLIAIVERDGTVSAVRVTQSLDPVYGLDASAVSTVRQWQFAPATKEGVAVRARIEVEMAFTLRGLGFREPTLAWPAPFDASVSSLENAVDAWAARDFTAGSLRISVRYPKGWTEVSALDGKIFTATLDDPRYPRAFVMSHPLPTHVDLTANMREEALKKMADQVKKAVAKTGDFKLLKSGQIRAPVRLWFWAELTRQLPRTSKGAGVMHLWVFTTTEQDQELTVFCSVVEPSDSYTMEVREQLNRAGSDFAAMISRIQIGGTPPAPQR
jgi:TonB family protein